MSAEDFQWWTEDCEVAWTRVETMTRGQARAKFVEDACGMRVFTDVRVTVQWMKEGKGDHADWQEGWIEPAERREAGAFRTWRCEFAEQPARTKVEV
mgnify:CR=1 FL=1